MLIAACSAQQRPECKPRRHGKRRFPARIDLPPLNIGRSANSGDTSASSEQPLAPCSAQQRPECKLRRHLTSPRAVSYTCGAQQRPECKLRRHFLVTEELVPDSVRSTKAGVQTPATPSSWNCGARRPCPLNKGRSANSGDTWHLPETVFKVHRAQQRPECKLRRHLVFKVAGLRHPRRSTKAGVQTPATP